MSHRHLQQKRRPRTSRQQLQKKRFSLTPELINLLMKLAKECKTKREFKGNDFEAMTTQYTEIRRMTAVDYPEWFGPKEVSEPT